MSNWIDRVDQARKEDAAEITRLRAELERVREAGREVVEDYDEAPRTRLHRSIENLRTALEGEEGK